MDDDRWDDRITRSEEARRDEAQTVWHDTHYDPVDGCVDCEQEEN